jgi:hypothetical protein
MSTVRGKRGRPQLPKGQGKTTVFSFRVAVSERLAFERAASLAGHASVSKWARALLLVAARQ